MRVVEVDPSTLSGGLLASLSGEVRLQYSAEWLAFCSSRVGACCGKGARLSLLAAFEAGATNPLGAVPVVRTCGAGPFPTDLTESFFHLWARHVDRLGWRLRLRGLFSKTLAKAVNVLNPSIGRALVLHSPLAPVSDILIGPTVSPSTRPRVVAALLDEAQRRAHAEDRCLFVPRLPRRALPAWLPHIAPLGRVRSYSNAEYDLGRRPPRRVRQMIRRNDRLVNRAGVTVESHTSAPLDVPFGALFRATVARHEDPAPQLDDGFFRDMVACFPGRVQILCARRLGLPVGFLVAIANGKIWEAFKCGVDREATNAPVYLDLTYGRLRDVATRAGAARVELGPGVLPVKCHYGASIYVVDSFISVPPSFRGRSILDRFLSEVSAGLVENETRSLIYLSSGSKNRHEISS